MGPLPPHHAPYAEAYREAGWWIDGPAPEHLGAWARSSPDRVALVDAEGRMTYAELDRAVRRAAAGLLALGVGPGDAVAIQLPNRRAFVVFQQAAARIGAVYVPLLPQLRRGDLEPVLAACGARVLVMPDEHRGFDHRPLAAELKAQLPRLQHVIVDGQADDASDIMPLGQFLAAAREVRQRGPVGAASADAARAVLFTSGTESTPKGVVHSYNTLFFGLHRQAEIFGFGPDEVIVCASPVGHGTGAVYGVELALMLGAKMVLVERWTPDDGLAAIAREGGTLMWGAATFFTDLARAARAAARRPSAFRYALTAGAPVPRELVGAVREELGAGLIAAYGQSEGQNIAINRPGDPVERITGSDGRLHDAIDCKILGTDGQRSPPGQAGELAYRGPNVCLGYLDPAHADAAFDAEGFLLSGDLVTVDEDRYLQVVGRRKDIIIRGGENISPAEVEGLLFGHPMLEAVAVVGYPDPRLGQRACAVVAPRPGRLPTLQDLTDWLTARQVARFKHPERILLVGALPMTASGKVRKDALREMLAAEGADA